jgi:hypothetical protein
MILAWLCNNPFHSILSKIMSMKIKFTLIAIAAFTFFSFTTRSVGKDDSGSTTTTLTAKDREFILDINETVDSINNMLLRYSEYHSLVRVNITGTMIITNNNMQFFHFNLADLSNSENTSRGLEVSGISVLYDTEEKISFNTGNSTVAYIRLPGISDEELEKLHQLFIHLRSSMMDIILN